MTSKNNLREILDVVTERGRKMLRLAPTARTAAGEPAGLVVLAEELLSGRGEATGYARARTLLDRYEESGSDERLGFLLHLARAFGARPERIAATVSAFNEDPSPACIAALHRAAEPRRQELIRRLNLAPGGTASLVAMRGELLGHLPRHPELKELDDDFVHLFSSWFNRGFLVMRPIDWRAPAHILEKIIRYEAVHAIRDWDDLRGRIDPPDRRCFAFFHPALESEPLIFVEVALTREVPSAIAPLIAPDRRPIDTDEAISAVFYSISACQRGLAGISFGNFLIKQVADDLRAAHPRLLNFVTLSPVPGFASWLEREAASHRATGLSAEETAALLKLVASAYWWKGPSFTAEAETLLARAAAWYLLRARTAGGLPVDPVARFHLGNGARLEQLNLLGDLSTKGLAQSHGLMVNYRYDLAAIEEQHEAYAEHGIVAASREIEALLEQPRRPSKLQLAKLGA